MLPKFCPIDKIINYKIVTKANFQGQEPCGQSYKQFTLVNYYSTVVVTKLLVFTTLDP